MLPTLKRTLKKQIKETDITGIITGGSDKLTQCVIFEQFISIL